MSLIRKNNFDEPVNNISHVHEVLQRCASKSVNQFLSLRNWLFGYYIVEYEQNGEDRANYGENLIANIAQKVRHIKGLTGNQLYVCRNLYLVYPHFLRTVFIILQSHDTEHDEILRTVFINFVIEDSTTGIKEMTESNNDLQLAPELLLSRLTFSHFIELIRIEDDLQRLFYEVETIKNN